MQTISYQYTQEAIVVSQATRKDYMYNTQPRSCVAGLFFLSHLRIVAIFIVHLGAGLGWFFYSNFDTWHQICNFVSDF